ncbi:hypothetical protein [uncultured Dokdonia sp.]|uniref:hypothetical protein n=1 Tax=uncultured Dokdonia sp. TaxID=575653 RepID=UPI0026200F5A|nr:hypothetical protein [uncultured Dokdonia sp.]
MKKMYLFFTAGLVLLLCTACPGPDNHNSGNNSDVTVQSYKVSIDSLSITNAPALQSFAHATSGADWLLFAGRTNREEKVGGLHNLDANYGDRSFIPKSFNQNIFAYNLAEDKVSSINYTKFLEDLKSNLCKDPSSEMCQSLSKGDYDFTSIFVNSNPLVAQDDHGYMYVVGGFGPKSFKYFEETPNWKKDTTKADKNKQEYITYNQVARLHIESMIKLAKGQTLTDDEWSKVFRYGTSTSLISTGAEVFVKKGSFSNIHKLQDSTNITLYAAGGHNFTSNSQKYLDAVYPFTVVSGRSSTLLDINVSAPISDVSDPTDPSSDDLSIFRRRDGPVVPSMYYNKTYDQMEQSLTFYGGVFKPGSDNDLQAWNDAIYVHPDWATESKLYTYDTTYNQKNHNVYACGNFVGYDKDTKLLHTFLFGGIGDGEIAPPGHLSGFTNTGLHIAMNVEQKPMQSKIVDTLKNVYGSTPNFYGAESILIKSSSSIAYKMNSENTEIIDLNSTFNGTKEVVIGHIYGGIEAYQANPGTYGSGNSAASNKVWQVTLTKE